MSAAQVEVFELAAHQSGHFLVDDLDDLLTRRQAAHDLLAQRPLLDAGDELLDHLEVDIGLQQGHAHFTQTFGNIFFRKGSVAFETLEDPFQFFAQTVKHGI
jgi:hypothetical protein